ncbi:MATE family efflux transporter [Maledivibacter halophilus]|uniref:Multidrug export protein MepA n=1 Tax=Maledivibacter halophilus TaxID=36842 RepID=A0A1T5L0T7_9FIRM|nr:MATE family efflux transporter [Maledivibacter halophilus]SKC69574.1 putative efflux protein, MATE family [Maledivibacter halophilus]
MENTFSQKTSLKEFFKFISPPILSMLFLSLYTIMDGIFVSHKVGSDALASINIVLPMVNLLCGIGVMLATGGSALISISLGKNNLKEANNGFSLILLFSLIIGVIFSVLGLVFNEKIFSLLGATEALMNYCKNYGIIILLCAPFYILKMIFEYFTRVDGAFNFSLLASLLGGLIDLILNYVFIYHLNFGIKGAALSTLIGSAFSTILCSLYFISKKSTLKYVKPSLDLRLLKDTIYNGSSEMVTQLSVAITTLLFNYTALKYAGESGVAAITIILFIQFVMTSVYLGHIAGISPIISFNYGAKNQKKIKEYNLYSKVFVMISSLIIFIICSVFSPIIVKIFISKTNIVYNITLKGLKIFAFSFLATGLNIYTSGLFTALSNGKISALLSFSRTFIFCIIGFWVLPSLFKLNGLWLVVPFAEFSSLFVSLFFLKRYKRVYLY